MFFFFKQKTAYEMRISDWSSDVCSSDLSPVEHGRAHPDQHAIADRAAVQDRVMADRAIHPQRQRKAGVRMEHRPFLDIGAVADDDRGIVRPDRSEEHTSELQSLMRISYAVFCLKKKKKKK